MKSVVHLKKKRFYNILKGVFKKYRDQNFTKTEMSH